MDGISLDSLTDSVHRLERENRRLKRAGALLLIGVVAVIVAGAQANKVPEAVEAQKFVVRDRDGKVRAELGMGEEGKVGLGIFGPRGKAQVTLDIDKEGTSTLNFRDEKGTRS